MVGVSVNLAVLVRMGVEADVTAAPDAGPGNAAVSVETEGVTRRWTTHG